MEMRRRCCGSYSGPAVSTEPSRTPRAEHDDARRRRDAAGRNKELPPIHMDGAPCDLRPIIRDMYSPAIARVRALAGALRWTMLVAVPAGTVAAEPARPAAAAGALRVRMPSIKVGGPDSVRLMRDLPPRLMRERMRLKIARRRPRFPERSP